MSDTTHGNSFFEVGRTVIEPCQEVAVDID
jgi:hypothetical protein